MRETETPHVHDFGISGRVAEPRNHLSLSLETPGYLKRIQDKLNLLKHIILKSPNKEIAVLKSWKGRAPTSHEGPSNYVLKILNMGSIPSRKHEMAIYETLKL